jgi:hypothetical protein
MKWFWMAVCLAVNMGIASASFAQSREDMDLDRDPAAIPSSLHRTYPGGADEEDLKVTATLPEAPLKTDARSLQKEVYKALYKQDLKEERVETVEE